MYSVDPAVFEAYKKNDKKNAEEKKSGKQVLTHKEVVSQKHDKTAKYFSVI